MRIVVLFGFAINTTGLVPKTLSDNMSNSSLKLVSENVIYIVVATVVYLFLEFVFHNIIGHSGRVRSTSKTYSLSPIILSISYFIMFSFLNFLIIVNFICRELLPIIAYSLLLNIVPSLLVYKGFIHNEYNKKIRVLYLISIFLLSIFMVIPYGSIVSHLFITYLL